MGIPEWICRSVEKGWALQINVNHRSAPRKYSYRLSSKIPYRYLEPMILHMLLISFRWSLHEVHSQPKRTQDELSLDRYGIFDVNGKQLKTHCGLIKNGPPPVYEHFLVQLFLGCIFPNPKWIVKSRCRTTQETLKHQMWMSWTWSIDLIYDSDVEGL